jgi:EsV-1-7 cysteine-rich motif
MVNVVNSKCAQEGCRLSNSFGYARDGKALFCSEHKKDSMVSVKKRPCEVEACKKQASHGLLSDKVCMCAYFIFELFSSLTARWLTAHTHHRFLATAHDIPLRETV